MAKAIVQKETEARVNNTVRRKTHTFLPYDSLWLIAQRYYGNGNKWNDIYKANLGKVANPNKIPPGTVLYLP